MLTLQYLVPLNCRCCSITAAPTMCKKMPKFTNYQLLPLNTEMFGFEPSSPRGEGRAGVG